MICPKCGNETSGNYCSNCGAPLIGGPAAETDRGRELENGFLEERSEERIGMTGAAGNDRAPEPEYRSRREANPPKERQSSRKKEKPAGSSKKEAASGDGSKESQKEKKQLEKRIRTLEEERQQREKEVRRGGRRQEPEEEPGISRKSGRKEGFGRSRKSPAQAGGEEPVQIIRETERAGDSTGGSFADAAVKGVTGVVVLMSRAMQLCCFLLMAGMVWASARAFWFCSDGLGNIDTMIADHNYSLALYVGAAVFSLFMGVIWCLWILSRKAAGGTVRLKKYDTGRGFIPFILCAAVIFAAGPASAMIPADGAAWHGLAVGAGAVLEAINVNHSFLAFCSVAGVILSLVRKLLRV